MASRQREPRGRSATATFYLYVEGARDRELIGVWARRFSVALVRRLARHWVILGGRQPERAAAHLRAARTGAREVRGLCVLDRDGGAPPALRESEAGLDLYVWPRRHIESYLLVPEAIRRALRLPAGDRRVERFFEQRLPDPNDEQAWSEFDAKRWLASGGPLERWLGRTVPLGRIARAMRVEEIHPDVVALLARLGRELGVIEPQTARRSSPERVSLVVNRPRRSS